MKTSIAILAAALLASAPIAARAQTSETPSDHGAHHPAPEKKDDGATKEQHGGGGHEGGCCKMMQEMHDMHGKMHGMKGHESKDGGGGEHGQQ